MKDTNLTSNYWQYRIIETEHGFCIKEVYFLKNGDISCWMENDASPFGESLKELKSDLKMMLKACDLEVLKESDLEKTIKKPLPDPI